MDEITAVTKKTVECYAIMEKYPTISGNGSVIYLPKKWANKRVVAILTEEEQVGPE